MSGIDDPSILWSKTLDPGEHFFIHSMIRTANLSGWSYMLISVGFWYQMVTSQFGEQFLTRFFFFQILILSRVFRQGKILVLGQNLSEIIP